LAANLAACSAMCHNPRVGGSSSGKSQKVGISTGICL
jgi:hypothetical protein